MARLHNEGHNEAAYTTANDPNRFERNFVSTTCGRSLYRLVRRRFSLPVDRVHAYAFGHTFEPIRLVAAPELPEVS